MTCIVFPGQGSQYIGMGKDFYDNFNISKEIFHEIEEYTNLDLNKIIFEENNNLINETKYTQISIFAISYIIFKTLICQKFLELSSIDVMLGHSLGEYTALACSEKISLKDACLILKKRGELMNNAVQPNKSGMAALIGCNSGAIEKIIKDNNINLQIANDNSPLQVVVSGAIDDIKKNQDIFLNNNVKKYVILNVSAAFHSKLMIDAQNQLSEEIEKINFLSNKISLISNYTADISNDSVIIKNSLKEQMSNKVRWTESINTLIKVGEKKIIEIGPGKVLSGLIKRISPNFDITSINTILDIS